MMHAALLFVCSPTITDAASHCMFHSFLPLLSVVDCMTSFPLLSHCRVQIVGEDEMSMFQMSKLLAPHMTKIETKG
jgi:hypothetical protein